MALMTMASNIETQLYRPVVTFQDTNVVGNVYFLTYFRWQAECRDQWLRASRPDVWKEVRSGESQLLITHWSTRFEDSFGATIGDDVVASLTIAESGDDRTAITAEVMRMTNGGSVRIAVGKMHLTMLADFEPAQNDEPSGPCYSFTTLHSAAGCPNPLDLLSLQGKCRELFLTDHSADTIRLVAHRELVLQTTAASIDLVQVPPSCFDQIRVEMRLESLKCGQMGVRFDYFADMPNGTSMRFAKGHQKMSSKHQSGTIIVPCPFPVSMLHALRHFTEDTRLLNKIEDILKFVSESADDFEAVHTRTCEQESRNAKLADNNS